jgi:hypothetical protein
VLASHTVRLGLIGPAQGDLAAVARAAALLVDRVGVDRVLYLGIDDALDRVVGAWARDLVGANPVDGLLFDRATHACALADAETIARFLSAERSRQQLRLFRSIPRPPGKTLELVDGRLAVLVWDKGGLDEEDIVGASFLVFGRSALPVVRRVGTRVFLAPGALTSAERAGTNGDVASEPSGIAVLHDDGGVRFDLLDGEGVAVRTERLEPARVAGVKLRVQ